MVARQKSREIGITPQSSVDPEVRPVKRFFSAAQKSRILAEADKCVQPGEIGAMLRREGIYSSLLQKWRRQRRESEVAAFTPKARGPKTPDEQTREFITLKADYARLEARLKKAELIIEVQKKVAMLLGLPLEEIGEDKTF